MSIKVGDYVIMNDSDKPCTRLVAKVIEVAEGTKNFIRGRYICKRTNMRFPQGTLNRVTLVSDFGVELFFANGRVSSSEENPSRSVATYPDGKPRYWQPEGEAPDQELFDIEQEFWNEIKNKTV